ncbi:MAG TPA: FecR domain-containing protein [Polyangia bacterium]|jgi:ferric-dicitrate binding protein FerR (iron transport regulator)|nr:FecR domain-containing protein [Polyangia bacterium]
MSQLDELMAEVAATQRAELERLQLESEIVRRLSAPGSGRRQAAAPARASFFARPLGLVLGSAAVAAVVAALWMHGDGQRADAPATPAPGLAFHVDGVGRPGQAGDLLEAGAGHTLAATFSDGSEVVVAAGTRARVVTLDPRGASIALERGRLDVHVVHRAETRWRVTTGAYQVRVTGTRFAVIAPAGDDALVVRMTEGSVEVSGPGGVTSVRAGEELHAGPTGFTVAAPSTPAATAPAISPASAPSSVEATRASAPPRDWRALAKRARYEESLAAAVAGNFGAACGELSAADVMLLGDVARLAGDVSRAEQAYGRALNRFPRLDRPAFALGLLAFEGRHDYKAAAAWFSRYLREHPSGPLATEASGRLIEALQQDGEATRARAAAATYLRQHPDGAHAALARSLVGS